MVGGGGGRVKAAIALVLVVGCAWHSYGRLAATHGEVLTAIARKAVDLVANGRMTAETMPELTYPLERAEAFGRAARSRFGDAPPSSVIALDALIARYRDLLDTLDRVRREQTGEPARAALADRLTAVEQANAALRTALRAERRL